MVPLQKGGRRETNPVESRQTLPLGPSIGTAPPDRVPALGGPRPRLVGKGLLSPLSTLDAIAVVRRAETFRRRTGSTFSG